MLKNDYLLTSIVFHGIGIGDSLFRISIGTPFGIVIMAWAFEPGAYTKFEQLSRLTFKGLFNNQLHYLQQLINRNLYYLC